MYEAPQSGADHDKPKKELMKQRLEEAKSKFTLFVSTNSSDSNKKAAIDEETKHINWSLRNISVTCLLDSEIALTPHSSYKLTVFDILAQLIANESVSTTYASAGILSCNTRLAILIIVSASSSPFSTAFELFSSNISRMCWTFDSTSNITCNVHTQSPRYPQYHC